MKKVIFLFAFISLAVFINADSFFGIGTLSLSLPDHIDNERPNGGEFTANFLKMGFVFEDRIGFISNVFGLSSSVGTTLFPTVLFVNILENDGCHLSLYGKGSYLLDYNSYYWEIGANIGYIKSWSNGWNTDMAMYVGMNCYKEFTFSVDIDMLTSIVVPFFAIVFGNFKMG